jgi:dTDP-4-dehydrorhamnose 3,5-epimerase-like enzyme
MSAVMLPTVDDLKPVEYKAFRDKRGVLVPIELSESIPFHIVRFFWVHGVPAGGVRGAHAHKSCSQYYVCAVGSLRVEAYDGLFNRVIELNGGMALHVPPAIFTTERFEEAGSVLMVFCDRAYDREDYLFSLEALVEYRRNCATVE